MSAVPKAKPDWKWAAEDDARTLANAEAIKMDGRRLTRARKEANKMAVEETRKARGFQKVAKGRITPTKVRRKK